MSTQPVCMTNGRWGEFKHVYCSSVLFISLFRDFSCTRSRDLWKGELLCISNWYFKSHWLSWSFFIELRVRSNHHRVPLMRNRRRYLLFSAGYICCVFCGSNVSFGSIRYAHLWSLKFSFTSLAGGLLQCFDLILAKLFSQENYDSDGEEVGTAI